MRPVFQTITFQDKGKSTMEKAMPKSGLMLLISLLLLFTLAGAAIACPPDCNDSNDCGPCQECVGGVCEDQCTGCQECVDNSCEDEDENCEGEQTCCGGVCCDNECCNQTCCGDPNESCCNNQCCNNCCGETCCDPCECCGDTCCGEGKNCCGGETCCDSGDVCCDDASPAYCCDPGQSCCEGSCCPAGKKCCKDAPSPYCCDEDKECCEGACCDSDQCYECECVSDCNVCCQDCGDCPDPDCCFCEYQCDPNLCYECDGNGNCVYQCDENQCEDCNTNNGTCEVTCGPCTQCDGQGNCVYQCDENECCYNGSCEVTCGECGECVGGNCVDDDDKCSSTQVCVNFTCENLSVSLAVEDDLTDCMEGRYVTYTGTASDNFPHGLLNPILFTFHFEEADGTPWTAEDWSTDLVEDHTCVADDVLNGDGDHKFTTPAYVDAANDGKSVTSSTLNVDVYELWIDYFKDSASAKDWKVVVNKSIAHSGIAASGAKNWAWDTADGVPDVWNPTGGNSKTGSGMVIPNSDLPDDDDWDYFGDTYGTVKVFCEDAEGGNNTFYSTSMSPSKKAQVFFERDATTNPGGTNPNWYYYWSENSASTGTHQYNSGLGSDGRYTYGNNYYEIGPSAKNLDAGLVVKGDGIDNFGSTCLHEKAHMDYYFAAWNPYNAAEDSDGDYVKDSDEPNLTGLNGLPYDPTKADTNGDLYNDEEDRACTYENNWSIGSCDDEDWSSPGHQW